MLRQLPLPPGIDPANAVISAAALGRMQRSIDVIRHAESRAADLTRTASAEAVEIKAQAQLQGYRDGFAQALQALVPVLGDLLAERSRWVEAVQSTVLAQLTAEFSRLGFTQAQIEQWCRVQAAQGAQQLAVYLPRDQAELMQSLQQPLASLARVELADVPAPVVTADELVFVLEPGRNLPVAPASEQLAAEIESFANYQAGRYLRLATRPMAAPSLAAQEPHA